MTASIIREISEQEKKAGGGSTNYNLLGRLYALVGDRSNADKYKDGGDAIEAEWMERYKDLFKATQSN